MHVALRGTHYAWGMRTFARVALVVLCALAPWIACGGADRAAGNGPDAPVVEGGADSAPAPVIPDGAPTTDTGADASRLSPSYVFKDVNHVLGTGQSLSLGIKGEPLLSSTQPYANRMFQTRLVAGGVDLTAFVPLVEGGWGLEVETLSSGFANLVTKMAREELLASAPIGQRSHDLLVSLHGVEGTPYAGLAKGTEPYAIGIAQVRAGLAIAKASNQSYVVRAVTNVHGETDHVNQSTTYAADLQTWQADVEADVKAITSQAEPVPMFVSQISSWTHYNWATSRIPSDVLAAHDARPGRIVVVGPKYHLPYADGVHLTNEGYRQLGEEYAKAYRRVVLEGKPWEPLRPRSVTRAGAVVTVAFHVPSPPLVLDTTRVTDPGANGFEFADDGPATPAITSVVLAGPETVRITLAAAPTAGGRRLRYAFTGIAGVAAGPTTGPRGNLRDSDGTVSRQGGRLYDWCVHFDVPVP